MTDQEIMHNIYKELYENAEPKADFDTMDKSKENWFLDYSISAEKEDEIIKKHIKGLPKYKKMLMRNSVILGCSPRNK